MSVECWGLGVRASFSAWSITPGRVPEVMVGEVGCVGEGWMSVGRIHNLKIYLISRDLEFWSWCWRPSCDWGWTWTWMGAWKDAREMGSAVYLGVWMCVVWVRRTRGGEVSERCA